MRIGGEKASPRQCGGDEKPSGSAADRDRDLMFGWRLYFGEMEEADLDAQKSGSVEPGIGKRDTGLARDKEMEYGWRLYFNELPVHAKLAAMH